MRQSLRPSLQPLSLFCGLSCTVTQAHHYRRGLGEARRALEVSESMRPGKGICDFSALGVLQLLTAIPDQELVNRFMKETLRPLFAANRKHPALLIDTLEAILQENGKKTARKRQRYQSRRASRYSPQHPQSTLATDRTSIRPPRERSAVATQRLRCPLNLAHVSCATAGVSVKIINTALRHQSGLFNLTLEDGAIAAIDAQPTKNWSTDTSSLK